MSEQLAIKVDGEEHSVQAGSTISDLVRAMKRRNVVIAKVDGTLTDLSSLLTQDCEVTLLTFDDEEGREVFWHSSSHILGNALVNVFNCKLVNGPATEEGFYYDVESPLPISTEDFGRIEEEMRKLVKANHRFEKVYKTKQELLEMYRDNPCKTHFIEKNVLDRTTIYVNGDFYDMCLGPHVASTGMIPAFKLLKTSSVYFLNDASNLSLQRIYGVSFPSRSLLKAHLDRLERAKEMDHRKIGRDMELFFFHKYSAGSCFWLPDGAHIYNRLIEFLRGEYRRRGFSEVITPNIFSADLWKESGHYQNYKDNIYMIEKEDFALKPMNCPGHCLMFRSMERSFRELPIRLADFGVLHRNEVSGALSGLMRVRRFQQDDAHIFCARDQVQSEITGCLEFLDYVYGILGFQYELLLSTRPEHFLGKVQDWDEAEDALRNAITGSGHTFKLNEGDGAFYGPKIDIILYDALGRKCQCATIQLDFQLPQRFSLKYAASDGSQRTPVMIHRAILGSLERMIAILLESFGKKLPFWLTPRQIAIIPISQSADGYAHAVGRRLGDFQVRVVDEKGLTLNKRIRNAVMAGYRLVCIVGKSEEERGEVNVRLDSGNRSMKLERFADFVRSVSDSKSDLCQSIAELLDSEELLDMSKCSVSQ